MPLITNLDITIKNYDSLIVADGKVISKDSFDSKEELLGTICWVLSHHWSSIREAGHALSMLKKEEVNIDDKGE